MTATLAPPSPAPPRPAPGTRERPSWRRHVPRAFAILMRTVAVISALAAVSGAFRADIQPVRHTIDALLIPAPANLAYAVFLATLAAAARRRKRARLLGAGGLLLAQRGLRRASPAA